LRARLRALRDDPDGVGAATADLLRQGARCASGRAAADRRIAACLAERAGIYPEGFAVLGPGPIAPDALAALLQMISGRRYPLSRGPVERLAAKPVAATLGGVRIVPAGRLGAGWLLVREAAAVAPPVPALRGAVWDGRFRLLQDAGQPDVWLGALGADAAALRDVTDLPSVVLQTMPALRREGAVVAVPHLGFPGPAACRGWRIVADPPRPAAGAPFAGPLSDAGSRWLEGPDLGEREQEG
jgi:tRNA(Ile)-lysidine synthase